MQDFELTPDMTGSPAMVNSVSGIFVIIQCTVVLKVMSDGGNREITSKMLPAVFCTKTA